MIVAKNAGAVGDEPLKQGDSLIEAPRLLVTVGEIVACAERLRMILTQNTCIVFEDLLVQGDGLIEAPCLHIGVRKVAALGEST